MNWDPNSPGLPVLFDYLKGILNEQHQWSNAVDAKSAMLWTLATAIVAVVVPIILTQLPAAPAPNEFLTLGYLSLISALYIAATVLAGLILWPHKIETMQDCQTLKQHYAPLPRNEALAQLLDAVEIGSAENQRLINQKVKLLTALFLTVLAQAACTAFLTYWMVITAQLAR